MVWSLAYIIMRNIFKDYVIPPRFSKVYSHILAENSTRSDEIFIDSDTLMSFTAAAAGRKPAR